MKYSIARFLAFLQVTACAAGCSTYLNGGEVLVPARETPPHAPKETWAPKTPFLSGKDPVYAAPRREEWIPDLTPLPRATWTPGAPIAERLLPMGRVWRITVHHEGMPSPNYHTTVEEVAQDLREIRKVHLRDMQAGDIGYHYIIDPEGRIWEGRFEKYRGAHAGGEANEGNLGIMLLGNFDLQEPTARQLKVLEAFLSRLMARFHVSPDHLYTHRELRPTRCPGSRLQAFMDALRRRL
jgi:hypothetical protein